MTAKTRLSARRRSARPARLTRKPRRGGSGRAGGRGARSLLLLGEGNGIELQAVVHQAVAEAAGDFGLKRLDLLGAELDHVAGLEVDEVVVVPLRGVLVARAAVAEVEPFDD